MTSIDSLRYPNKSHRKQVTLPEPSEKLAEFFGIMMGDGGINNSWQANITLNAIADRKYSEYVLNLCEDLFGIKAAIRKRKNRQALVIVLTSTSLIDYFVNNGLPRGDKIRAGLKIPYWICKNPRYKIACMRGLMDTDGCLYIHKHTVLGKSYSNIGLCFTTYSPALMDQIQDLFVEFDIIPHISRQGRCLFLYKKKAVTRYMEVFGTSNERIQSVYDIGGVG